MAAHFQYIADKNASHKTFTGRTSLAESGPSRDGIGSERKPGSDLGLSATALAHIASVLAFWSGSELADNENAGPKRTRRETQ